MVPDLTGLDSLRQPPARRENNRNGTTNISLAERHRQENRLKPLVHIQRLHLLARNRSDQPWVAQGGEEEVPKDHQLIEPHHLSRMSRKWLTRKLPNASTSFTS